MALFLLSLHQHSNTAVTAANICARAGLQRVLSRHERGARDRVATQPSSTDEAPLVTFRVARSFAHQSERTPRIHPSSNDDEGDRQETGTGEGDGGEQWSSGSSGGGAGGSILSFKELELTLGPLDFTAHERFLQSAFSFAVQLPLQDIWQARPAACSNCTM